MKLSLQQLLYVVCVIAGRLADERAEWILSFIEQARVKRDGYGSKSK